MAKRKSKRWFALSRAVGTTVERAIEPYRMERLERRVMLNAVSFNVPTDYATGNSPYSVANGDFNGDGKPDLAVVNVNGNTVSVLLNNSNGTFASKRDYISGLGSQSVTTGDFNGDGKPDLAVANGNDNIVAVLLNNGDGTFAAKINYAVGSFPISVTTGDFNGDGKLDLAVANAGANTVSVLLNNGTGAFAGKMDYATGSYPFSVTSGDFNGDGKPDLAVANSSGSTVSVLVNTGIGMFSPKIDYAAGSSPHSVTTGDFNGDGRIDLAVANYTSGTVSILLNIGNASFAPKVSYATGPGPFSVTTADFNRDSKLDLAVVNFGYNFPGDTVSILRNNGNGTFATTVNYATRSQPISVTAADFNGDGIADVAVANSNADTISLLLNNGSGTFTTLNDYTSGSAPSSVVNGDFNGDGKLDLAVANEGGSSVSVSLNTGTGAFAPKTDYAAGSAASSVITGDFNGDGKLDLAVANEGGNSVSVLLNNGNGTFAPKNDYATGSGTEIVTLGDFNGDGKLDLAIANEGGNSVSVLLNNGNGTFAAKHDYPTGATPESITTADFNGDGKPDLATANEIGNSMSVLLNNGDGTFALKIDYLTGLTPDSVTTGDFNGDGRPDLVVANTGTVSAPGQSISVLLNNGNGTFAAKQDYPTGSNPISITTADFNADGTLDLAVANSNGNTVSILLNNGNGTFAAQQDYPAGSFPSSVTAGDFNGDGKPDLAVANYNGSTVTVLLNTTGTQPAPTSPGLSASPGQTVTLLAPSFFWNVAGTASEYGLYISKLQTNGTYALVFDSTTYPVTISGNANSFQLPAGILVNGGQYRWNMNAKIGGVWGAYTGRLYFTVSTTALPSAPTGLALTGDLPAVVVASWNTVPNALGYDLYRSSSPNGPWLSPLFSTAITHQSDAVVQPNTIYYYRVAAHNAGGSSPLSPVVQVTTAPASGAPVPTLTATANGPTSVLLSWTSVLAGGKGEYVLYRQDASGGPYVPLNAFGASTTSWTDSIPPLKTPQQTYNYAMRTLVYGAFSSYSPPASVMFSNAYASNLASASNLNAAQKTRFDNVAKVYKWTWLDGDARASNPQWWAPVSDLTTIDWTKQTIMLTHGWNDTLGDIVPVAGMPGHFTIVQNAADEFMNIFAADFMRGREGTSPENSYNILAVDWYDGDANNKGSKNGSDPDGNPSNFQLNDWDATKSANNADDAAKPLADRMASIPGVDPSKIALIGHSNGAAFMANLAMELDHRLKPASGPGTPIAELVALDAPRYTLALEDVSDAASTGAVAHVDNYYAADVHSVGFAIFDDHVTNFDLNPDLRVGPDAGAPWADGLAEDTNEQGIDKYLYGTKDTFPLHTIIPMRFADTAAIGETWGFATSPFMNGGVDKWGTSRTYNEGKDEGTFPTPDPKPSSPNSTPMVSTNLWSNDPAHPGAASSATPTISGTNSTLLSPFGTQPSTLQPWIDVQAHSPVVAAVDVKIPSDAVGLTFDLTVQDSGNDDTLVVSIGNDVIGQEDLSLHQFAGNGQVQLSIGSHAGELTTLVFSMPSDVASSARFVIGNVQFISPGTPLNLAGAAGGSQIYLRRNPDGVNLDVWQDAAQPGIGVPTQQVPLLGLSALNFVGSAGNDSLVVDYSNGDPVPLGLPINFDGGAGGNSLRIIGTPGDDTITVDSGGVLVGGDGLDQARIFLTNVQAVGFAGGSGGNDSINLTGGIYTIDADTLTGTPNVSVTVGSTAVANFATDQHLNNLTLTGGIANFSTTRHSMFVNGLSMSNNGLLDIANSFLYLNNTATSFATVKSYLDMAYNLFGALNPNKPLAGDYAGLSGITSSIAKASYASDEVVGIGYYDGALQDPNNPDSVGQIYGPDSNSGHGTGIPLNQILIRSTLTGDFNGDGVVNSYDVSLFNSYGLFNNGPTPLGWQAGDLNGDGLVNVKDVAVFNSVGNFNQPPFPVPAVTTAVAKALAQPVAAAVSVSPKSHQVRHHSVRKAGHGKVAARIARVIGALRRV